MISKYLVKITWLPLDKTLTDLPTIGLLGSTSSTDSSSSVQVIFNEINFLENFLDNYLDNFIWTIFWTIIWKTIWTIFLTIFLTIIWTTFWSIIWTIFWNDFGWIEPISIKNNLQVLSYQYWQSDPPLKNLKILFFFYAFCLLDWPHIWY